MSRKALALLVWLISTCAASALDWGVQHYLQYRRLRETAEQPPAKTKAEEDSRPPVQIETPTPVPIPTPTPTPTPPPLDTGWDKEPAGDFDLFVLSQEKRWQLGLAKVVDADGEEVEDMRAKLGLLLSQLQMNYGDLIAVGTASCEGSLRREGSRAENRSEKLVEWLREALVDLDDAKPRQIYRLSLGRFRVCHGLSPEETDKQRRVVVLAIRNQHGPLDMDTLRERLRQDLSGLRTLSPADYSEFSLYEAR